MRKTFVPTAVLAIALGGLAACAHPSAPDAPYPTTAGPVQTTSGNGAGDQTSDVCAQATSVSASAAATIRAKGAAATAAIQSGDQATAIGAIGELKSAANDWAGQLTQLSSRPIKPQVKTVLEDGAAKITSLAAATSVPADADAQLTDFTSRLATACA